MTTEPTDDRLTRVVAYTIPGMMDTMVRFRGYLDEDYEGDPMQEDGAFYFMVDHRPARDLAQAVNAFIEGDDEAPLAAVPEWAVVGPAVRGGE